MEKIGSIIFAALINLTPLLILVFICMNCLILRERRRVRANNINQNIIRISSVIVNPIEQISRENNIISPPPPYTAEDPFNFDHSLPSYECAINTTSLIMMNK